MNKLKYQSSNDPLNKNNKQNFPRKYNSPFPIYQQKEVQQYPLSVAMENIATRLTGFNVEKEKQSNSPVKGMTSSLQDVIVTRNDAPSTLAAVKKRLDVVPQKYCGEQFRVGAAALIDATPPLKKIVVDEALVSGWLETLTPEKRSVCQTILNNNMYWQGGKDREVFSKNETLLKEPGSMPRLIHNCNPVLAVFHGAVANELQRRAAMVLSEKNPSYRNADTNRIFFPCGKSDKEIAELRGNLFVGPGSTIEGDFKNNDATQPPEVRDHEAAWYGKLGAPDWFIKEVAEQKHISVFARQLGLRFEIDGQRHSGEECGTIGNSFCAAATQLGALIQAGINDGIILIYGDDSLVFIPKKTDVQEVVAAMTTTASQNGMQMEIVTPPRERATFLQTRVYTTQGGEHFPIPKVGRVLSKINIRANLNPEVGDREYMAGKYLSAAYQFRHSPQIRKVLFETSNVLSTKPYIGRELRGPQKLTAEQMVQKIAEPGRVLSPVDSALAYHTIYGLEEKEIVMLANKFAYSCLRHLNRGDSVIAKNQPILVDEDGPVMAELIRIDNTEIVYS